MSRVKTMLPQLRFEGFSGEWCRSQLKNILCINSGRDYKHLSKGDIPVFGTGGYMLSVDQALSTKDAVGIGRKGTINKPLFLKAPFWTVDTLFFLTTKQLNIVFLFYLLSQINWLRYDESTGVPSLSKRTIEKISTLYPSRDEQTKIGELFQKLDRAIELQQQKVEQSERYKKAMLQKMFPQKGEKVPRVRFEGFSGDWVCREFREIFDYERPDKYIVQNTEYSTKGIPVLTANKSFLLGYTDEDNFYKKGNCIIFDDFTLDSKFVSFPFMVKSSAIKILTPKKGIHLAFAFERLNTARIINEGHARHYISIVQPFRTLLPLLEEQTQIGNFFQKLDQNIEFEKEKLKQYQTMKRAMLQRMFV